MSDYGNSQMDRFLQEESMLRSAPKNSGAIIAQRMIAAWNKNCEISTRTEDHMLAALDAARASEAQVIAGALE